MIRTTTRRQPNSRMMARALAALATAVLTCATAPVAAEEQSGSLAISCALREIKVITLVEQHGEAQDLPSDRLLDAALTMLRARSICAEGRVAEALALYDGILNGGPVVTMRSE